MSGALAFFIVGAVSSPALFGWWDGGFWTLLVILGVCFLVFSRSGRFAEGAAPHAGPAGADPAAFGPATAPVTVPHAPAPAGAGGTPGIGATTVLPAGTMHDDAALPADPSGMRPATGNPGDGGTASNTGTPANTGATAASLAGPPGPAEKAAPGAPTTPLPRTGQHHADPSQEKTLPRSSPEAPSRGASAPGSATVPPAGFGPPPSTPAPGAPAPRPGKSPQPARLKAMPGYAATIVLGLAVLLFAMIVGLSQLGMLDLAANAVAVGLAVALIVIALGLIGAALNRRTGGALVGFGIAALVLSLLWGGGSLRDSGPVAGFRGITTTDDSGTTNVFHSGKLDLRSYSTITSDTTVKLDNVFSSVELTVPDNIPVVIESQGAFGSLQVNGAAAVIRDGATVLNAGVGGPELHLEIDGAFSSIDINVAKAEVAP